MTCEACPSTATFKIEGHIICCDCLKGKLDILAAAVVLLRIKYVLLY